MVIGFMQKFPDGTPTNFEQKILSGEKIHTIRRGGRWQAGMLMHMSVGVRTKKQRQFAIKKVVSVQDVFITAFNGRLEITVDERYLYPVEIEGLLRRDGLTEYDLLSFLKKNNALEGFAAQIVHWTDFRYR